jgi:hypothetical protein
MGKKRDKSQRTRALKPAHEKQATKQRAQVRRVAAKGASRGATNASRAFMDTFVRQPGVISLHKQFGNKCPSSTHDARERANEPLAAPMNARDDQDGDPEYDDDSLSENSSTDDDYTPSGDDDDWSDDDVEPRRWCPEMEKALQRLLNMQDKDNKALI